MLLELVAAYSYTLGYCRGTANCDTEFLSHLPQAATEEDTSETCSLSHPEVVDSCFLGAPGFHARNHSDRLPSLDGDFPVYSTSVVGGRHSDESLRRILQW